MSDTTTPQTNAEEQRIREVYAGRVDLEKPNRYSWEKQDRIYAGFRVRSVAAAMLIARGWRDLSGREVLDVGCGGGSWLRSLLEWGVPPSGLHGIDLLPARIAQARALSPHLDWHEGSAWPLPFADASMDLVTTHTVLSSILDPTARAAMAAEMQRVLKPDGLIMIYDFVVSDPRNPDTVGIPPREVARLFPGLRLTSRTLTLAPPIARRLCPLSPLLAACVEGLFPFLRTHRLYLLQR